MYQRVCSLLASRGRRAASGLRSHGQPLLATGRCTARLGWTNSHLFQRVEQMCTSSTNSFPPSSNDGADGALNSDSDSTQEGHPTDAFHPHTYFFAVRTGDINLLKNQLRHLESHKIHTSFLPTALRLTRMNKFLNYLTLNRVTTMHMAAGRGNVEICRMLINAGADVNAIAEGRLNYGRTPIFSAIEGKNEAMIRLLLDNGAKVTVVDGRCRTPRSEAYASRVNDIINMINEAERTQTRNATYPGGCNLFTSYVSPPFNQSNPLPGVAGRDHRFLTPPPPELLHQVNTPLSDMLPHAVDPEVIHQKLSADAATYVELIQMGYIVDSASTPSSSRIVDPNAPSFDLVGVCTNVTGIPFHDLLFTLAPILPPGEPKQVLWRTPTNENLRISVLITNKNHLGMDRDLCHFFMECIRAKKIVRVRATQGTILEGKELSLRLQPDNLQILVSKDKLDKALERSRMVRQPKE